MKNIVIICLFCVLFIDVAHAADEEWEKIHIPGEAAGIRCVSVCGKDVIVTKGDGIYTGKVGTEWERIPIERSVTGATICHDKKGQTAVLAWNENELFRVENNSWKRLGSSSLWRRGIDDVVCRDGVVYVASGGDLYSSSCREDKWDKTPIFKKYREMDGNADYEGLSGGEVREENVLLSGDILLDEYGNVIIVETNGIFVINEKENMRKHIATMGLPSARVRHAARAREKLFAATDKKVFLYLGKGRGWQEIFSASRGKITLLETNLDDKGREWLWVSDGRSLFRRSTTFPESSALKHRFPELSIREVHKMAIDYAEVSPEKIRRWRSGARWKALLPRLSLGFGESRDDKLEIYTSSTRSYHYAAPKEVDSGWDVDLIWDLSDLVWNDAQTNIDVRSKLMVQLRDEILEEVTRLYFERKKLLAEMAGADAADDPKLREKSLRVEELTAHIDALTGGRFSESLKSHP